jgi:PKD domain-containing protein
LVCRPRNGHSRLSGPVTTEASGDATFNGTINSPSANLPYLLGLKYGAWFGTSVLPYGDPSASYVAGDYMNADCGTPPVFTHTVSCTSISIHGSGYTTPLTHPEEYSTREVYINAVIQQDVPSGGVVFLNGFDETYPVQPGDQVEVDVAAWDNPGWDQVWTVTVPECATNQPPVAKLSVSRSSGNAPLVVRADGSQSTDDNAVTGFSFAWGDGTQTGNQAAASAPHTYSTPGSYTVTLTATDAGGLTSTATQNVVVAAPPPPTTKTVALTPVRFTAPHLCANPNEAIFALTGVGPTSAPGNISVTLSNGVTIVAPLQRVIAFLRTAEYQAVFTSGLTVKSTTVVMPLSFGGQLYLAAYACHR